MTAVQWILQRNHPDPRAVREIAAVVREMGDDAFLVDTVPRSSEMPDLGTVDPSRPAICYGPAFLPRALAHPELSPGIHFDPARFRWSAFRAAWGERMLSRGAEVVSLGDVAGRIGDGRMFVRPDEDSKAFDGGLHDAGSFGRAVEEALRHCIAHRDTAVVVGASVPVDAEWRTFVVDGEVVAASSYRVAGEGNFDMHVPHGVVDLALDAAKAWTPADVFCLDVALSDGRYGIVEANCFNASRFYGADAGAIVSAVSASARRTRDMPAASVA